MHVEGAFPKCKRPGKETKIEKAHKKNYNQWHISHAKEVRSPSPSLKSTIQNGTLKK
jgi:hypothetical protein